MRRLRCILFALALSIPAVAGLASPASADDIPGGDNTGAVAINTEDGASVFRLAFSIRMVANGVVDQTNSAYALASCTDCQTVALAFQVVLVQGDVDIVIPRNTAVAYNDQCIECVTYASATQIVLGFDGPVRFTDEGRRRLAALYKLLREMEGRVGTLTLSQLNAEVQAAKAELIDILNDELVEARASDIGQGPPGEESTTTSTSGVVGGSTTSTTTINSTSTTVSAGSSTSTTSSTTSTVATTVSTVG